MSRTLHRLWLGPRPMPERYKYYGDLWKMLNPEVNVHDWSWHDLPEDLSNIGVMEDLRSKCSRSASVELATQLADIISYDLVATFGGIYANADIKPTNPIPERLWDTDFATYEEKDYDLVVNAFFGASPKAEFWFKVVDNLENNYRSYPANTEMVFTTGPQYLTKMHKENPGMLSVEPYYTVNPLLWKDVPLGQRASDIINTNSLPEGCIGIHDWGHRETGRGNTVI